MNKATVSILTVLSALLINAEAKADWVGFYHPSSVQCSGQEFRSTDPQAQQVLILSKISISLVTTLQHGKYKPTLSYALDGKKAATTFATVQTQLGEGFSNSVMIYATQPSKAGLMITTTDADLQKGLSPTATQDLTKPYTFAANLRLFPHVREFNVTCKASFLPYCQDWMGTSCLKH